MPEEMKVIWYHAYIYIYTTSKIWRDQRDCRTLLIFGDKVREFLANSYEADDCSAVHSGLVHETTRLHANHYTQIIITS